MHRDCRVPWAASGCGAVRVLPSRRPRNGRRGPGRKEPIGRRDLRSTRSSRRGSRPPEPHPRDGCVDRGTDHAEPDWSGCRSCDNDARRLECRAVEPDRVHGAGIRDARPDGLDPAGIDPTGFDGALAVGRALRERDAERPHRRGGPDADPADGREQPAPRARRRPHADSQADADHEADGQSEPDATTHGDARTDAEGRQREEAPSAVPGGRCRAARSQQDRAAAVATVQLEGRLAPRIERDRGCPAACARRGCDRRPAAARGRGSPAQPPHVPTARLTGVIADPLVGRPPMADGMPTGGEPSTTMGPCPGSPAGRVAGRSTPSRRSSLSSPRSVGARAAVRS